MIFYEVLIKIKLSSQLPDVQIKSNNKLLLTQLHTVRVFKMNRKDLTTEETNIEKNN